MWEHYLRMMSAANPTERTRRELIWLLTEIYSANAQSGSLELLRAASEVLRSNTRKNAYIFLFLGMEKHSLALTTR